MRYYSLLYIIISIPGFCYSQDSIGFTKSNEGFHHFSISLSGGVSLGYGLFHMAPDFYTDGWLGGECAEQGSATTLNCDYKFKKHKFELIASVGFNRNNYVLSSLIHE